MKILQNILKFYYIIKMLKKIRSFHIFKIVFSYLNDAGKLKLIKYNKKIQRKININLMNYKLYSDKYIIYETKKKKSKNIILIMI